MLQAIAKAYSEKDTKTLFSYYADDFVDEKSRKDLGEWLESMESITMTPYKIIPYTRKMVTLNKSWHGRKKNVFLKMVLTKS